jgi:hypothetical protein
LKNEQKNKQRDKLGRRAQPTSSSQRGPELIHEHRQGFTQLEPVAGGVCEEESALSNKASSLDSSSASRLSSLSSSLKRFSLASDAILSLSVSCSMSYTGRQFNIANKRRQGGKVETYSDRVIGREAGEAVEIVIAVVGGWGCSGFVDKSIGVTP